MMDSFFKMRLHSRTFCLERMVGHGQFKVLVNVVGES